MPLAGLFSCLFSCLFWLAGASPDDVAAGISLPRLELLRVIRGNRDLPLLCIQGFTLLPRGEILIADRLDYRIKIVDTRGNPLRKIGGRGEGPGKFLGPGPIDYASDRIAVADFASSTIQTYSSLLGWQTRFRVPGTVADLCWDFRGNLWVVLLPRSSPATLSLFGRDGRLKSSRPLRHATGNAFADVCALARAPGGGVVVTYLVRNIIEVWDANGRWCRDLTVPGLPAHIASQRIGIGPRSESLDIPEGVLFWSMTVDARGRIFILGGDCSEHPGRDVYVLGEDGRSLGQITLLEEAAMIRLDSGDRLWAVGKRRDSLSEYRLSWTARHGF
jgi:hypothetical protein